MEIGYDWTYELYPVSKPQTFTVGNFDFFSLWSLMHMHDFPAIFQWSDRSETSFKQV